ncbi:MAG: hypothetical protein J1D86_05940 [Alistipes sp.]|nr:hypothetical protein [Alistipes sp.]
MKRKFIYLLIALSSTLLWGCPVHQWPEPKRTMPTRIHLTFEPDFYLWEHYYDPTTAEVVEIYPDAAVDEMHPGTTDKYRFDADHGLMRYAVRAYRPDNLSVHEQEAVFMRAVTEGAYDCNYDCDCDIELEEAGTYCFAVWSDLVEYVDDDVFHDASDFHSIELLLDRYCAVTDYRDAFRGTETADVEQVWTRDKNMPQPEAIEITMRRPLAKFEFVTTDLSEFLDRETARRKLSTRAEAGDYAVRIHYTGYLPYKYSIFTDKLVDARQGVSFGSQMTVTGQSEASMGFDYVFINDVDVRAKNTPENSFQQIEAQIFVYDMENTLVAQSQKIPVPLRRNYHTLLRGAFLSQMAQGGIEIDPSYDGDHNFVFGSGKSSGGSDSWESNPR